MASWENWFRPWEADESGLVAVGGVWDSDFIYAAYLRGCFPWPVEGLPILWFSPNPRGILELSHFHVGRTLRKILKNHPWTVTYNNAFPKVMELCRDIHHRRQGSTWILPEMIRPYTELWERGKALSVELWNHQGDLVGGIYGVLTPRYFSAESMFYLEPNASKVALYLLMQHLHDRYQMVWLDIQMLTPVTQSLGGQWISRAQFLKRIGVEVPYS
ncbi:MAG: leucyl/phenylalanyl-tRNA--protein transferase [Pseudobdellovibrionaceae bacterium]|nr:leucyl/phenylalanyl-tRNA--protein transferase [Pseudobdellovibrionaceae bacterium]